MRPIDTLVWHCTATPEGREFSLADITAMHKARGFRTIGYHKLIHLDGSVSEGRPEAEVGAHVKEYNARSLGFSYVGGLRNGKAADTRTAAQKATMLRLTIEALKRHPGITRVVGHRDLSPDMNHDGRISPNEWVKECPCFDATAEYRAVVQQVRGGR